MLSPRRTLAALVTLIALAGCPGPTTGGHGDNPPNGDHHPDGTDGGNGKASDGGPRLEVVEPLAVGMTVDGVTRLCDDNLDIARKIIAAVKRLDHQKPDSLSWERTLGRLDDAFLAVGDASEFPYLMGVAHTDENVRNAARACETKTDELNTSIWLDADLAHVIKAYAEKHEKLSPERQRFLDQTLRDFRRNGLDLPADKQQRLRKINAELTDLGQRFIAEISASTGKVALQAVQLRGLPDDYIKAHPPGPDKKVVITTDYPDYYPFAKYALDRDAARELYIKFTNRGGDANVGRLDRILALRYEKAQLLGYTNWADYAIEPRMAKTAAEVRAYLDRLGKAIRPAVDKELDEFRKEFYRVVPKLSKPMTPPDRDFLTERLKNKRYKLDGKELEKYFEVTQVTKGLLDVTAEMYGLEYRPVDEVTWHPSVKAYEVWSGGKLIGKFYLDLYSRENKYKHAAMFAIRTGKTLAGGVRQTPIAALVCNFPDPGQPMPHDQVVTYFHEYGHVLHHLLTETELASFAGTNVVRDFVETPSQLFEEWPWSREVLDRFARHAQTGEKLPDAIYQALTESRRLGLALATERQIFLAMLDLAYHTEKPGFDTTKLLEQIHKQYFSFEYVKGTHFQSSFGHLIGYDAGYYGYQWAMTLAYDALSRFQKAGLLDKQTAGDWRRLVLAKGGAADERQMIHDFLGRDPTEQAYVDYLQGNERAR
jgi:oligopeptidase A